ncbi:aldose 1-epimerase [Rhodospirillaceae bacterium SYSU D60014]|uniref:aldose 1-epimerase n=1 Tax=Virgifigura deserti TaxID=2268457 RepID=UPI000E65F704
MDDPLITAPDVGRVTLTNAAVAVDLAPGVGGSIAACRIVVNGRLVDLLRPAPAALANPLEAGCFPLVPFSGPVFGGGFRWEQGLLPLARTNPREPDPIHGDGWMRPWQVLRRGGDAALLEYRHRVDREPEGAFPFPYVARLCIRLLPDGFAATLSVRNAGPGPMPAGLGLHPYFTGASEARVRFAAHALWRDGPELAAVPPGPIPPGLDFSAGRPIGDLEIDHCFEGWGGQAWLEWPDRGVAASLTAEGAFGKLQLFHPRDADFFCVEPVANANDGFNRMAAGVDRHGIAILAPGVTLSGRVALRVAAI